MRKFYTLIVGIVLVLSGCESDNPIKTKNIEPLNVNIRMEVQILDSTYQLYTRPFTKIYFTTYKLNKFGDIEDLLESDTTSCQNGWGVKPLNFTIVDEKEKIILGAACENYKGPNYREIEIDYDETLSRVDSTGSSNIVKTFAIYYN